MTRKGLLGPTGTAWCLRMVVLLVALASSRMPVYSSVQRLGSAPVKRIKACDSELPGSRQRISSICREKIHPWDVANRLIRNAQVPIPPSLAMSPSSGPRQIVGRRRPGYLDLFESSSSESSLPPPEEDPLAGC